MSDLINRQAAIDAIKKQHCLNCDSMEGVVCRACKVDYDLEIIESLPSARNRHDYFKALLDFRSLLEHSLDFDLKSQKKYKTFVMSMLDAILKNSKLLDDLMTYGSLEYTSERVFVKPTTGEVFVENWKEKENGRSDVSEREKTDVRGDQ